MIELQQTEVFLFSVLPIPLIGIYITIGIMLVIGACAASGLPYPSIVVLAGVFIFWPLLFVYSFFADIMYNLKKRKQAEQPWQP